MIAGDSKSRQRGILLAILAGLCGALASVFGKLAMDETWLLYWIGLLGGAFDISEDIQSKIFYVLRILCFGGIVAMNAVMWNVFTKAMNLANTVESVVTNNSFNFFFSALFGLVLFGEALSLEWTFGATIILVGLYFMNVPSGSGAKHIIHLPKNAV